MDHEESYTSLDTSTHEVAEDERGVPEVQSEQSGRTGRKLNSFGIVTSVVIMADGSTL